nr:hypothetical protein CFP56_33640 [Quercus suber]
MGSRGATLGYCRYSDHLACDRICNLVCRYGSRCPRIVAAGQFHHPTLGLQAIVGTAVTCILPSANPSCYETRQASEPGRIMAGELGGDWQVNWEQKAGEVRDIVYIIFLSPRVNLAEASILLSTNRYHNKW